MRPLSFAGAGASCGAMGVASARGSRARPAAAPSEAPRKWRRCMDDLRKCGRYAPSSPRKNRTTRQRSGPQVRRRYVVAPPPESAMTTAARRGPPLFRHRERHRSQHVGWLRASVLGANDGIVSTASLVLGVASANAARPAVLVAGVAGLVAGALSMAAGEYVSVSSQADTERADLEKERRELATEPESEHAELAQIYQRRGLTPELARQVADQLMAK